MKTALILGGGGFIGVHMTRRLKSEGYWVRAVDLKYPDFSKSEADEFLIYDLRRSENVGAVMRTDWVMDSKNNQKILQPFQYGGLPFTVQLGFDEVYQFAADMGGAGYIFSGEHDADVMNNSALINLHVCEWSVKANHGKIFYSSSACMYPQELQSEKSKRWFSENKAHSLKEDMAYPANPDSEYGWEKLFSERLYLAYARNYGLDVRIARFHNIYGPEGAYEGGKEKAPAATCRKVIEAAYLSKRYPRLDNDILSPSEARKPVTVWGDGKQTRSFLYIDDCIDAVRLLMQSDFKEPINIGSEEMVSIDELTDIAIRLSGEQLQKVYDTTKPQGVRGRNSDNTLNRSVLKWIPKVSLREGMEKTYRWIESKHHIDL